MFFYNDNIWPHSSSISWQNYWSLVQDIPFIIIPSYLSDFNVYLFRKLQNSLNEKLSKKIILSK